METVIARALWQAIRHATLVDCFDILIVSLFIYVVLRLIRRARAARVLQGLFVIAVIYFMARQGGLVLTTSLFRGVLMIAMVSLASIFQEDIKRIAERLTALPRDSMRLPTLQALLRSIRHFSKHHIGALIVLKGRDPLDRHMDGGQPLNGSLSSALLESLFDPHSDGHDGALILQGDYAARFGVHLPLSKNLTFESGLGTRHAAALGLSELTDALCVVVSETRGTIMIAREGHLENIGDGEHLERRLMDFLNEHAPVQRSTRSFDILWNHPAEKALSLCLGLMLWLVFAKGVRPAEKVLSLPVRMASLPAGVHSGTVVPPHATVTLRGLEKDMAALPKNLSVSLSAPTSRRSRQQIPLTVDLVRAPAHLRVASISPPSVMLELKTKPSPTLKAAASAARDSTAAAKSARRAWLRMH